MPIVTCLLLVAYNKLALGIFSGVNGRTIHSILSYGLLSVSRLPLGHLLAHSLQVFFQVTNRPRTNPTNIETGTLFHRLSHISRWHENRNHNNVSPPSNFTTSTFPEREPFARRTGGWRRSPPIPAGLVHLLSPLKTPRLMEDGCGFAVVPTIHRRTPTNSRIRSWPRTLSGGWIDSSTLSACLGYLDR